ncbi:MAG TPA: hypothetical protein VMW58_10365 [Anaerolineae bacterium]|nr:hypothetical protein [Anaerolineae bacterium]
MSYTYDRANRLTQVSEGSLSTQFAYNGDGVRTSETESSDTTEYVRDLAAALPVVISDTEAVYLCTGWTSLRASRRCAQIMGLERSLAVNVSLGLLILGLCVGCGEPPPLDMSLLTGEPCQPPCWQGLTPGESTEEDVAEFMRATRFVDTRSVRRSSYTRLTRGGEEVAGVIIHWRSSGGLAMCNDFCIEEGLLTDLTICPYPGVTLGHLIDRYGPPEKYEVIVPIGGPLYYDVTLFYATHGFTVDLVLPYDDGTLRPESSVAEVWYFRAAPLERFLQLRYDAGYGMSPARSLEVLRDWPGYGPIELE